MFLTVTPNSSLDRVIFIDQFVPGGTARTDRVVNAVGGKGFDTSVVLRALGQPTTGLGFVAGKIGRELEEMLLVRGIQPDLLWVDGETRISYVIVETGQKRHSHITAGRYSVSLDDLDRFFTRFQQLLPHSVWAIAAGSLPAGAPPDFYARLARFARQAGVPYLVDCFGEPARLTLDVPPTVLKMNRGELNQTFGLQAKSLSEVHAAAHELFRRHRLENLVITLGTDGLLAVTAEGAFLARAPLQEEVNAAGSGDAASAAIAWQRSLGSPWPLTLQWAAAAGAAVVLTEGTAECLWQDVDRIFREVEVCILT
jgi:1-phosphofructokinase family hexose kinase